MIDVRSARIRRGVFEPRACHLPGAGVRSSDQQLRVRPSSNPAWVMVKRRPLTEIEPVRAIPVF